MEHERAAANLEGSGLGPAVRGRQMQPDDPQRVALEQARVQILQDTLNPATGLEGVREAEQARCWQASELGKRESFAGLAGQKGERPMEDPGGKSFRGGVAVRSESEHRGGV